jgi:hypothetical protein
MFDAFNRQDLREKKLATFFAVNCYQHYISVINGLQFLANVLQMQT